MEVPQAVKYFFVENNTLTLWLITNFVLISIIAFFSANEIAMFSLDQEVLERESERGDRKSAKILRLIENQSKLISTTKLVFVILTMYISAILSIDIFAKSILILRIPFGIYLFFIILIWTVLIIVFGELVPKRVALVNANSLARFSIDIIVFFMFILSPITFTITILTNFFLKIFGVKTEDLEGKITLNDIKSMVQLGQSQGVIDQIESDMINSVIEFDEKSAEEIMTPRTEVFMIDINDDFTEYKDDMFNLKYSRIPVYDEDIDNIIGILYLKDFLLESYNNGFENVDIRKILKPTYFVPERKNINELFSEMQRKNRHMALLIDEYGGFEGIVTMEDLVEEIMGNIDDEYDFDEPELIEIEKNRYKVLASIAIKDFNNQTGLDLEEDSEDFDTIGGLIISLLGYIPEDGEKPYLETKNISIQVLEVKDRRIQEAEISVFEDGLQTKDIEEDNEKS